MHRLILLALMVSLFVASTILADIPLPKDVKQISPRVRFDGREKYADYAFVLRYQSGPGNPFSAPVTMLELKNTDTAITLKLAQRTVNMQLLAMDRKDFEKRKSDDGSLKWLSDKTEGVLKANVIPPRTIISIKEKEVPVTTYKVEIKEGKLSCEMAKEVKRGDAAPAGLLPMWAFGLVSALSLASFGVWAARRRQVS